MPLQIRKVPLDWAELGGKQAGARTCAQRRGRGKGQEKKGKVPKAYLQRQPEHPFVMMESDALQSGSAGAQPPKKKMDHYEPPTGSR